ncbi:unnamed protein product [Spirodela intermedia]|uniref:Uncharacterized protein n=1 Tax=Spirodela intermedia TaxID=51605 RepID=A0A7I8LHX0_SPIIN|nr:unnamed protein product [Spirodela intermedia]
MELVPFDSAGSTSKKPGNVPWAEMFRSASARRSPAEDPKPPQPPPAPANYSAGAGELHLEPPARLALFIAMAHAGLAFSLLLFYGLYRLLEDFLRPIQWAVLCSIPLREIQQALVSFWSEPLSSGLTATLLAVPAAAFRFSAATVVDLRIAFSHLLRRRRPGQGQPPAGEKLGFRRLLRWLASFGVFVLAYEQLGSGAVAIFVSIFLFAEPAAVAGFPSRRRRKVGGGFLTGGILSRLKTLVAIALIAGMLAGVLLGGAFFSYKIAMESKDAVVSIKSHVQSSNYAERVGFRRWMEENDVSGRVDRYTAVLYGAVLEQVDGLAVQYNLTDLADELKHFLLLLHNHPASSAAPATALVSSGSKLQSLAARLKNREWAGIYAELRLVFNELQATRADLVGKMKGAALNAAELLKRVAAGGSSVFGGAAGLLLSLALAVLSGAAEVINFVSQTTVFVWVLYYLITAETGGATEQVVGMIPVSDAMRGRCVEVIDGAISSVLLATAKIAIFQGCLTWLLFRVCSVHFLYVSTVLAVASPLLPVLPGWLSTLPAAAQLVVEGRYISAAAVSAAHQTLMGYGVSAIQQDIPGYNEYLTGLSILGGMALFPSAFEGAIMGPLIMTVMIAFKNLYAEFVLGDEKGGPSAQG